MLSYAINLTLARQWKILYLDTTVGNIVKSLVKKISKISLKKKIYKYFELEYRCLKKSVFDVQGGRIIGCDLEASII